jgi:2-polyprenyl-3-methyl-5-hydroxy-6-metoxy-1,4-benzoquinol methylase
VSAKPPALPPWKTCLDFDRQDAGHYEDHYNETLFGMIAAEPRRVLDLGCSTGRFGEVLKGKYPSAWVAGVEAGQAAAAKAASRLDRVVHAKLDGFDFSAHGFEPGEFDLVVAADILEHLFNPWQLLADARRFMAPQARLLLSLPNVRNVALVGELLAGGRWRYAERGLLDITHLRFFTLAEIGAMLGETGFVAEDFTVNITPALGEFYRANENRENLTVKFGRLSLENVGPRELAEICAEQFFLRARLA